MYAFDVFTVTEIRNANVFPYTVIVGACFTVPLTFIPPFVVFPSP